MVVAIAPPNYRTKKDLAMKTFTMTLVAVAIACRFLVATESQATKEQAGEYYDLGEFHSQVTTDSNLAQTWFDRGLAMCIGFNHEEAIRCFEIAYRADPGMPMALWGMAYAWGPNINNMLIEPPQMAKADLAAQLAATHALHATELERDLITAISTRYETPLPKDRDSLNRAYSIAMRDVYKKHSDSPLVTVLFAESLMNLQPWKHWSSEGEPAPLTVEIVRVLEDGLKRWPNDTALCHFYIHMMEASPEPGKALTAADHLRDAMPGQGHLVHMPSHIDVLVGNYDRVITANQKAIVADNEFLRREGPYNFYTLYRIHNFHFLVYGAMFDGQSELALRTARELVDQVPEDMLREQVDFIDAFIPTALHVMIRFGRWDEILNEPEPADYLPVTKSIWHYARALAYASTGRVEQAELEQEEFDKVRETVPDTSFLFQNASQNILDVAESMIAGEIAYRKKEYDHAFEHLQEAIHRDDALNYDEPWGWMQPARHALGALLLEQGRVAEAEPVFRADLKRHPNNPWALNGLAESLAKQGKQDESAKYRQQFKIAAQRADVKIDRSCYCRLETAEVD
jgi:tetratricopeptide (TPR) repeat protein